MPNRNSLMNLLYGMPDQAGGGQGNYNALYDLHRTPSLAMPGGQYDTPDIGPGVFQKELGQALDRFGVENGWNASNTSWGDAAKNSLHYFSPLDTEHEVLGGPRIPQAARDLGSLVAEPFMAAKRLGDSGVESPYGIPAYNEANKHDMTTLNLTMFGGQAFNPFRAGEGMAAASAESHLRPGLSLSGNKGPRSTDYNILMHDQNIGRAYVREYPETVQIDNFSINPEHQRQGIGTEVQREIARLHGKPNVPGGTLFDPELARWQKNDPAAVADYEKMFEGASSSSPRVDSDAYWASQGQGVVPGTRASSGELFSDTGKPSLMGSALAGLKDHATAAYKAMRHPLEPSAVDLPESLWSRFGFEATPAKDHITPAPHII